jgi:hypothetical protein
MKIIGGTIKERKEYETDRNYRIYKGKRDSRKEKDERWK